MTLSLGTIAALICIVFGFIVGIVDEKILFDSTTWFIAAIAFALIGGPTVWPRQNP